MGLATILSSKVHILLIVFTLGSGQEWVLHAWCSLENDMAHAVCGLMLHLLCNMSLRVTISLYSTRINQYQTSYLVHTKFPSVRENRKTHYLATYNIIVSYCDSLLKNNYSSCWVTNMLCHTPFQSSLFLVVSQTENLQVCISLFVWQEVPGSHYMSEAFHWLRLSGCMFEVVLGEECPPQREMS